MSQRQVVPHEAAAAIWKPEAEVRCQLMPRHCSPSSSSLSVNGSIISLQLRLLSCHLKLSRILQRFCMMKAMQTNMRCLNSTKQCGSRLLLEPWRKCEIRLVTFRREDTCPAFTKRHWHSEACEAINTVSQLFFISFSSQAIVRGNPPKPLAMQ